jgi:integrase
VAVDDTWYLAKRGSDGERTKSAKYGRGKRWRVRYTDDTGRPREQMFERRADADRFDANIRADLSRGNYVDPSAGKLTVALFGEQWRLTQLHRDSTAARIEMTLRLHVNPRLGHLSLGAVRPSHVQGWVKDRSAVLAPSSMGVVYGVLAGMFAAAVKDRLIGSSPCLDINLPDVERPEHVIATPAQVHALAEALEARPHRRFQALVYVGAGLGLRQGEAWGLELAHIDFLRREVQIVQQLTAPPGREPRLSPVKTATSKRTVELPQVVAEALARHIEEFPPAEVEIDDVTDPRRPVRRLANLLFVSSQGNPLRRSAWTYPWAKAVKAAGLPTGYGFHGLRHHYATALINAGASVKTVQLALGHSKPTITLDVYAGCWPEAIDRTRTIIDAALGTATAKAATG